MNIFCISSVIESAFLYYSPNKFPIKQSLIVMFKVHHVIMETFILVFQIASHDSQFASAISAIGSELCPRSFVN